VHFFTADPFQSFSFDPPPLLSLERLERVGNPPSEFAGKNTAGCSIPIALSPFMPFAFEQLGKFFAAPSCLV